MPNSACVEVQKSRTHAVGFSAAQGAPDVKCSNIVTVKVTSCAHSSHCGGRPRWRGVSVARRSGHPVTHAPEARAACRRASVWAQAGIGRPGSRPSCRLFRAHRNTTHHVALRLSGSGTVRADPSRGQTGHEADRQSRCIPANNGSLGDARASPTRSQDGRRAGGSLQLGAALQCANMRCGTCGRAYFSSLDRLSGESLEGFERVRCSRRPSLCRCSSRFTGAIRGRTPVCAVVVWGSVYAQRLGGRLLQLVRARSAQRHGSACRARTSSRRRAAPKGILHLAGHTLASRACLRAACTGADRVPASYEGAQQTARRVCEWASARLLDDGLISVGALDVSHS